MSIEQEISDIIDVLPDKMVANGVTLELNHVNRYLLASTMWDAGLRVVKPEPVVVNMGNEATPEQVEWMRAILDGERDWQENGPFAPEM